MPRPDAKWTMLHGNFFEERVILNSHKCVARTGVIVMDSSLNVLASNAEAFQIFGCVQANLAILSRKEIGRAHV